MAAYMVSCCIAVLTIQSFILILISLTIVYIHPAWTKVIGPKSFPQISRFFTPTNIAARLLVDAATVKMYYSRTIYFVCTFYLPSVIFNLLCFCCFAGKEN